MSTLASRRWAAPTIQATLVVALIPALIWLAPQSDWGQPGLLAVLLTLAVIADFNEIPLPGGVRFDAGLPLALIALAILGPLPGLLVSLLPIAIGAVLGRDQIFRPGNFSNITAFTGEAFVASLVLSAAHVSALAWNDALPWLLATGVVMCLANFGFGPSIFLSLYLGHTRSTIARAFFDMLPTALIMVGLAAVTAVLVEPLGIGALALFALIAVLPQTALTLAARTRSVAALDPLTATRRYSHALALHLGLDRAERRHLARVTDLAFARRAEAGDPIAYARQTLRDPSRASWEAGHVGEWWNGGGGPAGLRGPITPIASRIVAVADTWSQLTARGGPELSHAEALIELHNASGTRFDPRVVQAARDVVKEERVSVYEPAPEPRLHLLRVPAPLRRVIASA